MEDETQDPAIDEIAPVKKKRLTPAQWAEIQEHYELGTKTAADLAIEFDITRSALSERFKKYGVKKGSRAHELQKAVNATVVGATQAQTQTSVERFADKRVQFLEETNSQGYQSLVLAKKLMDKTLMDAHKNSLAPAAVDDDLKALRRYNLAIIENTKARREILGAEDITDESQLPVITIDDLTKQMILDHHKYVTGAAPEDATIDDLVNIIGDIEIETP